MSKRTNMLGVRVTDETIQHLDTLAAKYPRITKPTIIALAIAALVALPDDQQKAVMANAMFGSQETPS